MATLFDQFGRALQAGEIRRPEPREISVAQLRDRWSTYPSNGLTPVRLAQILREADNGDVLRQAELFEEMEEKDAHLASQFQIRKLAVQGLDWDVVPAADDSQARKIADFCRDALTGLTDLDEHILDLLDALPKGYSMMEMLWDVSAGQAAIRDMRWVHPKKITFWDSLTPRVLTEEEPVRGIDPPPWKFVYHRCKARSGYDTRSGIMRVCAWMYLFKNFAVKDWVAFAEVYGMPIRIGKFETGASAADKQALQNAIRSIGSDAAGIISKATEIEFIESQKSSTLNVYESLARFCDAQTSKAILGQTLTSEAGGEKGQGSLALGKVHADVRQDLTEADCKALEKTISRQVLRPLVGFNFGWDVPVPAFKFRFEPPEDIKSVAETYKILRDMGFALSQEHVSERFKVPIIQEGETPLDAPKQPPASAPQSAKKIVATLKSTGDPGQDFIDRIAEALADRQGVMDPLLKPLLPLIAKAGSYEEILAGVYDLHAQMDTGHMEELIQQAMFAANVWGYMRAREES